MVKTFAQTIKTWNMRQQGWMALYVAALTDAEGLRTVREGGRGMLMQMNQK